MGKRTAQRKSQTDFGGKRHLVVCSPTNTLLAAGLTLKLDQVAQGLVQMTSEHPQGRRFPSLSEHLCQCWATRAGEQVFLLSKRNFPCHHSCPLSLVLLLCPSKKNLSSLQPSFRYCRLQLDPCLGLIFCRLNKPSSHIACSNPQ